MCLYSIDETFKSNEGVDDTCDAWKVIQVIHQRDDYTLEKLPINPTKFASPIKGSGFQLKDKWITAEEHKLFIDISAIEKNYFSGFHSLLSEDDAEVWYDWMMSHGWDHLSLAIVKVRVRNITAVGMLNVGGTHYLHHPIVLIPCIVSREMYVPSSPENKNELNA